MAEVVIDPRKLRLYKYQVDNGMMLLENVPEPYQTELRKQYYPILNESTLDEQVTSLEVKTTLIIDELNTLKGV